MMAAHTAAGGQQLGASTTPLRCLFLAGSRLGAPRRRVVLARQINPRSPNPSLQVLSQSGGNGSMSTTYINDRGILVESGSETPFKKILCANRGEIAVRVFRAGTELGLRTLAVYSAADRLSPHRFKADESYQVGSPAMSPVQCYLDVEGILALAKQQGVDCIHPGYGFLSENATFARRCGEEGITFIGPRPETIDAMGDKTAARRAATECGVPVVPGTDSPFESVDDARAFCESAGYPVMLKAAMGGGGRGMRVVRMASELDEAFARASNEARGAFGDGRMFVEKLVEDPRHVEVQVMADHHGNVVHLHERDCSVQRRHQKVVEIAPAYGLDPSVRAALHADAVKIAQHVGYRNAGTVEFMVDKHGGYYFLEVNPRIQVEHTVTEEVTGLDLVQLQVKIAGGASLPELGIDGQAGVPAPSGYALQVRITSEDPERNFQPDTGRIQAYRSPGGPGIRLDAAVTAGSSISRHYDSLLVKTIVRSSTFNGCVQKMQRALYEFQVRGVKTNIAFLENVLRHPEFLSGQATTSFIERNPQLFQFNTSSSLQSSKLLSYLADVVVNGGNHPGATGAPPARVRPRLPQVVLPEGGEGGPPPGWRDVLLRDGPDGWAKAVRSHQGVLLTDTTWRDAHQSLLATRMRTYDMLKVAPATAHVLSGAASLEMWGGATFDVALRFLHECPWRRLEALRELVPNVPFQMLLRGANAVGYTSYADNVVAEFVKEARTAGVDIFRIFDSLNYVDNLKFGMDAVRDAGGVVEATLCYSGDVSDPSRKKYTLDYYMDLAEQLVDHGTHVLAIKDMAGLLRPPAATMLVGALRERWPDLPIHVHTHDSAGTGVATQMAAAAAGADIVDACIDSMSGTTSQPSMGALVNALRGTERDTGVDPHALVELDQFWEDTRLLYAPFESNLKTSTSEVYYHEMPGGQYTNLKFQAASLGLGDEWNKVKDAYAAANRVLGDVIKVTPSSKVVGDLAQFMVQNSLSEEEVEEQAGQLSLPSSVVDFLQGQLGQPVGGFPEPLRSRVLQGKPTVDGRPGASMPPVDLRKLEGDLVDRFSSSGGEPISKRDVLSSALYPKVFEEYRAFTSEYSHFTENLPTRAFFAPLAVDEEIDVEISRGNVISIKLKAVGELQSDGTREVFFETNGIPRMIEMTDRSAAAAGTVTARDKADLNSLGSVGAPMSGEVIEVFAKPGAAVLAGQPLLVLSAMKMETAVGAPCSGTVQHVAVLKGDQVDALDLLVSIKTNASGLESMDEEAAAAAQQRQPAPKAAASS